MRAHSEENTPLDLDDHGGRTFLRVLLHLTMHDYPPLVSRALHLLFRHFSQRQEVLQAFKQVNWATLQTAAEFSVELNQSVFLNVFIIFIIFTRSSCLSQAKMLRITSKSNQTWISCALSWKSLSCGCIRGKDRTRAWTQERHSRLNLSTSWYRILSLAVLAVSRRGPDQCLVISTLVLVISTCTINAGNADWLNYQYRIKSHYISIEMSQSDIACIQMQGSYFDITDGRCHKACALTHVLCLTVVNQIHKLI